MKITNLEIQIEDYRNHLRDEERSPSTIKQYQRDVISFLSFLDAEELSRERVLNYKHELEQTYHPASVNAKLAALNSFFSFIGRSDLKLKLLKVQKSIFCSAEKELSKEEYLRLIKAAQKRENEKLSLLLQTNLWHWHPGIRSKVYHGGCGLPG